MTVRILDSRAGRKLRRNKLAMFSMGVVFVYLLLAVAMTFGLVTDEDCTERVGANIQPGFFQAGSNENRYEVATEYLYKDIKTALQKEDPEKALAAVQMGQLRVIKQPVDEIQPLVDRIERLRSEINQVANLNQAPEIETKLTQLEEWTGALVQPLTRWQSFVRNFKLFLGTDRQGRSILLRALYSIKVAVQIGMVTAIVSVFLGSLLGAAAGYFGGAVDYLVTWLYTTFASIPNLILLVLLAYVFSEWPWFQTFSANPPDWLSWVNFNLLPVYVAFCATFWIGPCRLVRGETLKIKNLEYVHAARTLGLSPITILRRHILPNTVHLMLINFSLLLIGAIKSEVILSFLGLGVKSGASWGIMIRDAGSGQEVINGFFWQIGAATAFMFVFVLAFNILSDALQDAFDPKHV